MNYEKYILNDEQKRILREKIQPNKVDSYFMGGEGIVVPIPGKKRFLRKNEPKLVTKIPKIPRLMAEIEPDECGQIILNDALKDFNDRSLTSLQREYLNSKLMYDKGIPVARPYGMSSDLPDISNQMFIREYIDGELFGEQDNMHGKIDRNTGRTEVPIDVKISPDLQKKATPHILDIFYNTEKNGFGMPIDPLSNLIINKQGEAKIIDPVRWTSDPRSVILELVPETIGAPRHLAISGMLPEDRESVIEQVKEYKRPIYMTFTDKLYYI